MKVLNLYAGIGGNRKAWDNCEVTAVEFNEDIAEVYKNLFPNDEVIMADAHEYLLQNFADFDFIWSSPPCPTHSRMRFLKKEQGAKFVFPDMKLYEEIIFLQTWYEGYYCIENVISYYEPLIKPQQVENHFFWANFYISYNPPQKRGLIRTTMDNRIDYMQKHLGINLSDVDISKSLKSKVLSNCVRPGLGKLIFDCMIRQKEIKDKTKYSNQHQQVDISLQEELGL